MTMPEGHVEHEYMIRLVVRHRKELPTQTIISALRDWLDGDEPIPHDLLLRHFRIHERPKIQPRGEQEPGPWSGSLLKELVKNGFIPGYARRVIIDIQEGCFVDMHIQGAAAKNGDEFMDVLMANIEPATVVKRLVGD